MTLGADDRSPNHAYSRLKVFNKTFSHPIRLWAVSWSGADLKTEHPAHGNSFIRSVAG